MARGPRRRPERRNEDTQLACHPALAHRTSTEAVCGQRAVAPQPWGSRLAGSSGHGLGWVGERDKDARRRWPASGLPAMRPGEGRRGRDAARGGGEGVRTAFGDGWPLVCGAGTALRARRVPAAAVRVGGGDQHVGFLHGLLST